MNKKNIREENSANVKPYPLLRFVSPPSYKFYGFVAEV